MVRKLTIAMLTLLPLLAGCPKKKEEVVDAAPPPVATPAQTVEDLKPMDPPVEDAGTDASDGGKKLGPAVNPNVARLKACCNQLAAEGKKLGASPEGGSLIAAAAQCTAMANQAAASGNAAEMGVIRGLLAGRTIPPVCGGF